MIRGKKYSAGCSSPAEPRKRSAGSFKTLVAAAQTSWEMQRREQERLDKQERDFMKLGSIESHKRHVNMGRRAFYQRPHHFRQPRKTWQYTTNSSTNNWRKGPSSRIETTSNNPRKKTKTMEDDSENTSQIKNYSIEKSKNLDRNVYISKIAPGDSTTGDDFLSHFKMEMSRGINNKFGCPKLVKFKYYPNKPFHEALMEFSTPFGAQRVLDSTLCNYRGKPLTKELVSRMSSDRLRKISTPKTSGGTSRKEQDTDANEHVIGRSPRQARRVTNDFDRIKGIPPSVHTSSPKINQGKSRDGIEDQIQDPHPVVDIRDDQASKETLPRATIVDPAPHNLSSLPASLEPYNIDNSSERLTVDGNKTSEKEKIIDIGEDDAGIPCENTATKTKDWKNGSALVSPDLKQDQRVKIETQSALADTNGLLDESLSHSSSCKKQDGDFQKELETMRKEYEEFYDKENEKFQRERESRIKKFEEKQSKLEIQWVELRIAKDALALELDESNQARAKAMNELKSLRTEMNFLIENNSKLEPKLAEKSRLVETQSESLVKLEMEKTDLQKEIDVLTKENKEYKERLDRTVKEAKSKKAEYETIQKLAKERHELELEQVRRTTVAKGITSVPSDAVTTRLKEELENKKKENIELQQNFNAIAMQNFKQSNTIEEQRAEIRRLQNQLRGGNVESTPLKIED